MTTLRLAMLYAFNKSTSGRAADAMETVRTLLTECGVKPSETETEKQAELLDFIAFKLPSVFPYAKEDCGARLLSMVLEEDSAFVADDESAMDAVALLASSGNDGMMSKLLLARRDLLSQASVFETITQAMVYGTEPMVLSSLRILDEAKIIGRTTHCVTGSTLLHFAAKHDDGRYVETLVKNRRLAARFGVPCPEHHASQGHNAMAMSRRQDKASRWMGTAYQLGRYADPRPVPLDLETRTSVYTAREAKMCVHGWIHSPIARVLEENNHLYIEVDQVDDADLSSSQQNRTQCQDLNLDYSRA
jgi:hypothetical protein